MKHLLHIPNKHDSGGLTTTGARLCYDLPGILTLHPKGSSLEKRSGTSGSSGGRRSWGFTAGCGLLRDFFEKGCFIDTGETASRLQTKMHIL